MKYMQKCAHTSTHLDLNQRWKFSTHLNASPFNHRMINGHNVCCTLTVHAFLTLLHTISRMRPTEHGYNLDGPNNEWNYIQQKRISNCTYKLPFIQFYSELLMKAACMCLFDGIAIHLTKHTQSIDIVLCWCDFSNLHRKREKKQKCFCLNLNLNPHVWIFYQYITNGNRQKQCNLMSIIISTYGYSVKDEGFCLSV